MGPCTAVLSTMEKLFYIVILSISYLGSPIIFDNVLNIHKELINSKMIMPWKSSIGSELFERCDFYRNLVFFESDKIVEGALLLYELFAPEPG